MHREFDIYIKDKDLRIQAWAIVKKFRGGIVVGNSKDVISYLGESTKEGDDIFCILGGAWLEQCVREAALRILYHSKYEPEIAGRTVSGVYINLIHSVALTDKWLSIEDRRQLLMSKLSEEVLNDHRFAIVP